MSIDRVVPGDSPERESEGRLSAARYVVGESGTAVRVRGMVRGREIDADGSVSAAEEGLTIHWPPATSWLVAYEGIDGIVASQRSMTIHLRDNDVLELAGDDKIRSVAIAALDQAFRIPELMRGGSALASMSAGPVGKALAAAHETWMEPWLSARRELVGVSDPERQVMLLDSEVMRERLETSISRIAEDVMPGDKRHQRALIALMEHEAAEVFASLDSVGLASGALLGGASDTRLLDWRRWIECIRDVFRSVDEAWSGIRELLTSSAVLK